MKVLRVQHAITDFLYNAKDVEPYEPYEIARRAFLPELFSNGTAGDTANRRANGNDGR